MYAAENDVVSRETTDGGEGQGRIEMDEGCVNFYLFFKKKITWTCNSVGVNKIFARSYTGLKYYIQFNF